MHRIIRMVVDLLHREPIAYAISYVEPDGTREVDVKQRLTCATWWADWCVKDCCTKVEIYPLYTRRRGSVIGFSNRYPLLCQLFAVGRK